MSYDIECIVVLLVEYNSIEVIEQNQIILKLLVFFTTF